MRNPLQNTLQTLRSLFSTARFHNGLRSLAPQILASAGALMLAITQAVAVIPASERNALQTLYVSTNGASWTNNTNWNGAVGTECTWQGVTCSAGNANVTRIELSSNNLVGSIPTLSAFTSLQVFQVNSNSLTGSIPSLSGLTALAVFRVQGNGLTGSIPALSGLTALQDFNVSVNALTGSIPSLSGLSTLIDFNVTGNNLSGSVPSLAGLTVLTRFRAGGNQLTGVLPTLTGSPSIATFNVANNQLTGSIPSLTGLTLLNEVQLQSNQLTGSIPSLTGLAALGTFYAFNNQLTGSIPSLTGLVQLDEFDVHNNQLTGSIPSLAGLTDLNFIVVYGNQLTGTVPAAPPNLDPGESQLCPNPLTPTVDPAWDAATGQTPWSFLCGGSGINYTVTPTVSGGNGAVSPNTPQIVAAGGSTTFTSIPNAGFSVSTVGITGSCNLSTPSPNQHLVSSVGSNCIFTVTFAATPTTFTVTPSVISGNGTISPATPQTVASGNSVSFTITPAAGFSIGGLQGSCSGNLVNNVFTTNAIGADCTVGVVFAPDSNTQAVGVPTLSEWMLLIFGGLLALIGALGELRRREID